jgi:hypothetical protein
MHGGTEEEGGEVVETRDARRHGGGGEGDVISVHDDAAGIVDRRARLKFIVLRGLEY